MLEPTEEAEGTSTFEAVEPPRPTTIATREQQPEIPSAPRKKTRRGGGTEGWGNRASALPRHHGTATMTNGSRSSLMPPQSLQDHLLWQLELAKLEPRGVCDCTRYY